MKLDAARPRLMSGVTYDTGVLAAQSGHDDVVDTAVVEGAIRRGDAVVTSDLGHIRKIAPRNTSTAITPPHEQGVW